MINWLLRMGARLCPLLVLALGYGGSLTIASRVEDRAVKEPVKVSGRGSKLVVSLAPALRQAIHRRYPGYDLPPIAAFDLEMVHNLSEERPGKPFVPFACVGDFDRNGLTDAALLLKNRSGQWRLVAFHQGAKGSFRPYRIGPAQGFPGWEGLWTDRKVRFYIERMPPGVVRHLTNDPLRVAALHLKHDGIHGLWSEEAARLYYFRDGRYQYVQTGD